MINQCLCLTCFRGGFKIAVWAPASLFRRFTDKKYRNRSVKIWKTRHRISVYLPIFAVYRIINLMTLTAGWWDSFVGRRGSVSVVRQQQTQVAAAVPTRSTFVARRLLYGIPRRRHGHRHRHPRRHPREDVGVGVVECDRDVACSQSWLCTVCRLVTRSYHSLSDFTLNKRRLYLCEYHEFTPSSNLGWNPISHLSLQTLTVYFNVNAYMVC